MGADLLVTWLVIDKTKEPDIEAGREAVRNLPVEKLNEAYEEIEGSDIASWEDPDNEKGYLDPMSIDDDDLDSGELTEVGREALKAWALKIVDRFEDEVIGGGRDMVLFPVRGAHIYLSGGMSWGDSPTDAFNLIGAMFTLGQPVLEAMGFEFEEV
jgi:hypothetical protein